MISVTRLDGSQFIINADLIETVEATPDTVISFAHDKRVVVSEPPEEVVRLVLEFRRQIQQDPGSLLLAKRPTSEQTSHLHKGIGSPAQRFRLLKQDESEHS